MISDENEDLDDNFFGNEETNNISAYTLTALLTSEIENAMAVLSPQQMSTTEKGLTMSGKEAETAPRKKTTGKRKRALEADDAYGEPTVSHSGGQYMNLPASQPQIELRDGIEWLIFSYSTRGDLREFTIRTDIENILSDDIPNEFKIENCVYPRALVSKDMYSGNRWEYETACNDLAWRLTWLNTSVMTGKRGLIQRAVDSYRNRYSESKSRRVIRQEKLTSGTLRRRTMDYDQSGEEEMNYGGMKSVSFNWPVNERNTRYTIRADIENVNLNDIDIAFKQTNAICPNAIDRTSQLCDSNMARWKAENSTNIIGWKLAYLNRGRLNGQLAMLQKAVDAYKSKYCEKTNKRSKTGNGKVFQQNEYNEGMYIYDKGQGAEIGETVSNTLKNIISDDAFDDINLPVDDYVSQFEEPKVGGMKENEEYFL